MTFGLKINFLKLMTSGQRPILVQELAMFSVFAKGKEIQAVVNK